MTVPIGTIMAYAGDNQGDSIGRLEEQGWLFCDGDQHPISDYPGLFDIIGNYYGTSTQSEGFVVPDLRGRFVRGVDHGAERDPDAANRAPSGPGGNTGDKVGSVQEDEFKAHTHTYHEFPGDRGNGPSGDYWVQKSSNTGSTGGKETRPLNIYVNWIIKAKDMS